MFSIHPWFPFRFICWRLFWFIWQNDDENGAIRCGFVLCEYIVRFFEYYAPILCVQMYNDWRHIIPPSKVLIIIHYWFGQWMGFTWTVYINKLQVFCLLFHTHTQMVWNQLKRSHFLIATTYMCSSFALFYRTAKQFRCIFDSTRWIKDWLFSSSIWTIEWFWCMYL